MRRLQLYKEETGFAALMVALTLVIILSLLTLGFAQLMRNEQNQTTNRQLSNQAYYAAESGVNDALRALATDPSIQKNSCGPIQSPTSTAEKDLANNNVNSAGNGSDQWTCLLINHAPSALEYSPVGTVTPKIFTAVAVGSDGTTPVSVSKVTISWKDASNSSSPAFNSSPAISSANPSFPQATNWPYIGMVRIGLTPLIGTGAPVTLSRSTLAAETITAYLYPSANSSATSMSDDYTAALTNAQAQQAQQGQVLNGGCSTRNTPFYCSATINFSPALPAGTGMLFNLRSIYGQTHVYLTVNGGTASLSGAQVLIDSSGRSEDIVKRIEVRAPSLSEYDYPGFSLGSTGDICKQLSVRPGAATGCGY